MRFQLQNEFATFFAGLLGPVVSATDVLTQAPRLDPGCAVFTRALDGRGVNLAEVGLKVVADGKRGFAALDWTGEFLFVFAAAALEMLFEVAEHQEFSTLEAGFPYSLVDGFQVDGQIGGLHIGRTVGVGTFDGRGHVDVLDVAREVTFHDKGGATVGEEAEEITLAVAGAAGQMTGQGALEDLLAAVFAGLFDLVVDESYVTAELTGLDVEVAALAGAFDGEVAFCRDEGFGVLCVDFGDWGGGKWLPFVAGAHGEEWTWKYEIFDMFSCFGLGMLEKTWDISELYLFWA